MPSTLAGRAFGEHDVALITGHGGDVGRRTLEDHVVRVALRLVFPAR